MARLALATLFGIGMFAPQIRAADARYNVLFIAVDDLRPELGCYPDASRLVKSPNIDRLAASGLRFDRAYCQFALCNPSRSSLLAGRRPETLQVFDLKTFVRKNNPDITTLPELFKTNGYETRSYGKIFHAGNGNHDDPASWSIRPWHSARDDSPAPSPAASAGGSTFKDESDPDTPDHSNDAPYEVRDVADEQLIDGQIASRAVAALRELKEQAFLSCGRLPSAPPAIRRAQEILGLVSPARHQAGCKPVPAQGCPGLCQQRFRRTAPLQGHPKERPIPDKDALNLIHGYYACVSYVDAQVGRLLNGTGAARSAQQHGRHPLGRPWLPARRARHLDQAHQLGNRHPRPFAHLGPQPEDPEGGRPMPWWSLWTSTRPSPSFAACRCRRNSRAPASSRSCKSPPGPGKPPPSASIPRRPRNWVTASAAPCAPIAIGWWNGPARLAASRFTSFTTIAQTCRKT